MKYLGIVLTSLVIVLVPFIFKFLQNKEKVVEGSNEIRQPTLFKYIGIFGILLFDIGIPIICFLELDPSMTWYEALAFCSIFLLILNFLYIYLLLLGVNWRVVVYDDYVEYYNLFKKKKIFHFSEYKVKLYSSTIRVVKQYKNKKNKTKYKCYLNISAFCSNYEILEKKYKAYKKQQKQKS